MPCDSVQLNRIDMPKMDPRLTPEALRAAGVEELRPAGSGWSFRVNGSRYTLIDGNLSSYDADASELSSVRNAIARGYSEQILKVAAQKNNWSLKKVGPRQFTATKR